jgi:hypothetical protein
MPVLAAHTALGNRQQRAIRLKSVGGRSAVYQSAGDIKRKVKGANECKVIK